MDLHLQVLLVPGRAVVQVPVQVPVQAQAADQEATPAPQAAQQFRPSPPPSSLPSPLAQVALKGPEANPLGPQGPDPELLRHHQTAPIRRTPAQLLTLHLADPTQ